MNQTSLATLVPILGVIAIVCGCASVDAHLSDPPPTSATLVRTWTLPEFENDIRKDEGEIKRVLGETDVDPATKPFVVTDLKFEEDHFDEILRVAKNGDQILEYEEIVAGNTVQYLCVARAGSILRVFMQVIPNRTQANHHPEPTVPLVTTRARHSSCQAILRLTLVRWARK